MFVNTWVYHICHTVRNLSFYIGRTYDYTLKDNQKNVITLTATLYLYSENDLMHLSLPIENTSYLSIQKKNIQNIYVNEEKYSWDSNFITEINNNNLLKTSLYKDQNGNYYAYENEGLHKLEGQTENEIFKFDLAFNNQAAPQTIDLQTIGRITYDKNDFNGHFNLQYLKLGDGLYADIYYHGKKIEVK